jgi:branched-chain amino acid transport system ATP-binding protein
VASLSSPDRLLETRRLSRSFGGLKAVEDVSFMLKQGEIRAVIGPNGAGKTTFVSLISGRLSPDSGEIYFNGEDVTYLPAHKRVSLGIAYTFQITSIYLSFTVEQNVLLASRGRGSAMKWLDRVGLAKQRHEVAGTLAYGHQRLLEVAMGLALEPKLLILDEPTQGLSDGEIAQFIELIKDISKSRTVLLIEHNMHVVMSLAETITVLAQGRILAEGTPAQVSASRAVQDAYLGAHHA